MNTMTRAPLILFTFLALVGLASCASGRSGGAFQQGEDEPTVLEVDNQSTFQMTIYVVRESGERRRLGEARSLTTTRFTIPSTLIFGITPLRFQADPVGANRTPVSQMINVSPGDTVVLRIPPS